MRTILLLTISGLLATVAVCRAQVMFTEYLVPTANSDTYGITRGPDGNLWFTELVANNIGRITPTGVITEFTIPTGGSRPYGITRGPDGNVWFTEFNANQIGRITPTGVITEFPIPTGGSAPLEITAGPDGNLWFTESATNKIGRITPAGLITGEFPSSNNPNAITTGPDGNLWFAEGNGNSIGRVTPAGMVTEFSASHLPLGVNGITAGPDGSLWFAEYGQQKIGRITTAGVITEFTSPTSDPVEITTGLDGNLWFTEQLGRIVKVSIGPRYSLCLLYDATKAVHSGATVPIKLQLCDGGGNDLSSSNIIVSATSVTQTNTSISGLVQESGNANPDNNFRFDSTLGSTGGYIFNLKTTGLTTGTYSLNFTVTGDSFVYAAPFQVK